MKKALVLFGILVCVFGDEMSDENVEFVEKVYNLEIKDDGSYAPKKRTWQDIQENEWVEKWQRNESGATQKYKNLSKSQNEPN